MLFALPSSICLSCLCKWEAWKLIFLSLLSWLTVSPFISHRAAWSLTAGARPTLTTHLWAPLMWEGECESQFEIPHLVSYRKENTKPKFHLAQRNPIPQVTHLIWFNSTLLATVASQATGLCQRQMWPFQGVITPRSALPAVSYSESHFLLQSIHVHTKQML